MLSWFQRLAASWQVFWGLPVLGNLTEEEYEEYDRIGTAMDCRRLTRREEIRFAELHYKRGIDDAPLLPQTQGPDPG